MIKFVNKKGNINIKYKHNTYNIYITRLLILFNILDSVQDQD